MKHHGLEMLRLKKKVLALTQKRFRGNKFICYKANSIRSLKKPSFKRLANSAFGTPLAVLPKVTLTSELSSTKDIFQCSYGVKQTAFEKLIIHSFFFFLVMRTFKTYLLATLKKRHASEIMRVQFQTPNKASITIL